MKKDIFIHETAIVEAGVKLGSGTKVWDNAHIRKNASIGKECIIGEKSYIAYDVKIGDLVKINAFVYVCAGVTIKEKVMIAAGVIFTNDRFPRAVRGDSNELYTSAPTEETEETLVQEGVTIGAGAVLGCGITLGEYSMVGMGSIVTKDVKPYHLVYGTPAITKGYVCRCGHPLVLKNAEAICNHCKELYSAPGPKNDIRIIPLNKKR